MFLLLKSMRLTKRHPYINKTAFYTKSLRNKNNKVRVIAVILKEDQIAMIEAVDQKGILYVDKASKFSIEGESFYQIDSKVYSKEALEVQKNLKNWMCQRTFWGPSWEGIEKLSMDIVRIPYAKNIGIESVGWYKYKSSTKKKKDGKDWRILLLDTEPVVVINCHSILTDDHWTLVLTIHDEKMVDRNKVSHVISENDPWMRSIKLSLLTAKLLGKDKDYNYKSAITDMQSRMKKVIRLRKLMMELVPEINLAYMTIFKKKSKLPDYITIGISYWGTLTGKIGRIRYPCKEVPWGEIIVSPIAFKKKNWREYTKQIITHELIHAALGKNCCKRSHGKEFNWMAEALELPKKYTK